jgi:hypothetical protein
VSFVNWASALPGSSKRVWGGGSVLSNGIHSKQPFFFKKQPNKYLQKFLLTDDRTSFIVFYDCLQEQSSDRLF